MTGASGPTSPETQKLDSTAPAELSSADQGPTELTRDEMNELLATGQAEHLAQHVIDFTTWQGRWWTVTTDGTWIPVGDAGLHVTLDRYQRRMKAGLLG